MNFNRLTDSELERLSILSEECGEVVQVIGKILRHGYESCNPFDDDRKTNRELLAKELGDVFYAVFMMIKSSDLIESEIVLQKHQKAISIQAYLHHEENRNIKFGGQAND